MTRRTAWPIDDDRLGHTIELNARMPEDFAVAHRDRVIRELVKAVEEHGYTTHPDIVRDASDHFTTEGAYGDRHHYRFPPARPRKGDPLRYENGPLKGDTSTVPYEGAIILPYSDVYRRTYEVAAFDTGTGHWIYLTNLDR